MPGKTWLGIDINICHNENPEVGSGRSISKLVDISQVELEPSHEFRADCLVIREAHFAYSLMIR